MPTNTPHPEITLTLKQLNRATLARQMLLQREDLGAVEAVERLGGLQAQYSPSPYIALWTRLERFMHDELANALTAREVIKASLMRWTLHIISSKDYPFYITAIGANQAAVVEKDAREAGVDIKSLHSALLDYAGEPKQLDELVSFANEQLTGYPVKHERAAWMLAQSPGWLVHTPPSGRWKYFGKNSYISAHMWLGPQEEPSLQDAVRHLLFRYLVAYGPATRADVLQWSGLRRVSQVDEALTALGDAIIIVQDEDGRIMYDLRTSPRPDADMPAPVRFLPKWDNLLLAYQKRDRVLPDRYRKTVIKINGDVMPTVLVDGMVAAIWSASRNKHEALLTIEPLDSGSTLPLEEIEQEGEKLLRFVEPDATHFSVKITG